MSVAATFHKNALIKNLVILFVFFCAVEPIYSFFKPIGFFYLIWMVFLVDIENNYLILCQFGYFLSRIPFWDIWFQRFKGLTLTFDFWLLTLRSHLRSKICLIFEILYKTSYMTSVDTFPLSRTVFDIFSIKLRFDFKLWLLTVTWGQPYLHHSKTHTRLPI